LAGDLPPAVQPRLQFSNNLENGAIRASSRQSLPVSEPAHHGSRSDLETAAESAILAYFSESPDACDSLQGIAEWWIAQYQVRFGVETVARVVERLADAGVLERVDARPEPLYRLRAAASGSQ
jgi:hypothetical protein